MCAHLIVFYILEVARASVLKQSVAWIIGLLINIWYFKRRKGEVLEKEIFSAQRRWGTDSGTSQTAGLGELRAPLRLVIAQTMLLRGVGAPEPLKRSCQARFPPKEFQQIALLHALALRGGL